MLIGRRKLLTGLIAAPIVVRAALIMPVKAIEVDRPGFIKINWVTTYGVVRYTMDELGILVRREMIASSAITSGAWVLA